MKKLSEELNQLGIKHLIFTLDNVSLKTFGDSSSVKIVGGNQNIQDLVGEALKKSKRLEEGKQDDDSEVFAASIVKLVAPPHSLKWKGVAQVRAQCSQFLQLYGYGLKDRKLNYGQGICCDCRPLHEKSSPKCTPGR